MWLAYFASIHHVTGQQLLIKPLHHDGALSMFLIDGCPMQALGLGDSLLQINDPQISSIHCKYASEIVQCCLHTCDVHCDWKDCLVID